MNCSLCGKQEIAFNLNTGKQQAVKHPENVKAVICSNCMQVVLSSTQDKLKSAYRKALHAGELAKAEVLRGFIRGNPDEVAEQLETKEKHGSDKTKVEQLFDRRPDVRAFRNQKKTARLFEAKQGASLYQDGK